jgi:hypothetical protein
VNYLSVWISDSAKGACSYDLEVFNKSNCQSTPRLQSPIHVTIKTAMNSRMLQIRFFWQTEQLSTSRSKLSWNYWVIWFLEMVYPLVTSAVSHLNFTYYIVTCQPIVGLRNRAFLVSCPLSHLAPREGKRCPLRVTSLRGRGRAGRGDVTRVSKAKQ